MKINHSFQINSLLKMIPPPPSPHFLENYFAEVKINKRLTWIKAAFNNNATALWWPSWWKSATAGHNFGRGPSNDYSIKVWF